MQKSHLGCRHCTAKCCRRKLLGGLHTPFPRPWLTPTCRRNDSLGRRRWQPASKIDRPVWKATDRTTPAGGRRIHRPELSATGKLPRPDRRTVPRRASRGCFHRGTTADRQSADGLGGIRNSLFPRLSSKKSAASATNWLAKTG